MEEGAGGGGGMESQGDVSLSPITKLGYGSHSERGGGGRLGFFLMRSLWDDEVKQTF